LILFILDTLIVGSLRFVLDQIAAAAGAELQDAAWLREQLLEAEMRLEVGEISREAFAKTEREILARISDSRSPEPRAVL
jgi:hypothetical protein